MYRVIGQYFMNIRVSTLKYVISVCPWSWFLLTGHMSNGQSDIIAKYGQRSQPYPKLQVGSDYTMAGPYM